METVIDIQHVSKIFKLYDNPMDRLKDALGFSRKARHFEHHALSDVSLSVGKGETVGIIGTNGAGKSTLLKIITGVLNPTEGTVNIEGHISALLELGAGFNMEYTGIENIYLNGTMNGFSREEVDSRIDAILEFADIGEFVNQPVKTYSSGMFVRLAFAVAINIDPEILIVDEALSVGDVFFQAKCYKKFEDFKKIGKTILFVSHDLGSISKYCDRVILLNKGRIFASGKPKEIVDLYKKLLVNQVDPEEDGIEETGNKGTDDNGETNKDNMEVKTESSGNNGDDQGKAGDSVTDNLWKKSMISNPDLIEYGKKEAEVIDYAVIDENGQITNMIEKGTKFTVQFKIRANEEVHDPIFAFTIKDIRGTEITGTNTMYEGCGVECMKEGDELIVTFSQNMDLQGGDYLIALGVTGFKDGAFYVYHRLYDLFNITVVSDRDTVGFFDMNSSAKVVEA